MTKATIFHDIFSVKSLTFVPFRSIAIYYWHFIISYRDKQNFSACYCTILPLGNIGKYFTILKQKVIFPILQLLSSWPYPQALDWAGDVCQGQHFIYLQTFINYCGKKVNKIQCSVKFKLID